MRHGNFVVFAVLLFTLVALCNCIVHPKPKPRYSPDFTFPTDEISTRQLPIWDFPYVAENVASYRVKREVTSETEQYNKCLEHLRHGVYSQPSLILTWNSSEIPFNPLHYLRKILANDLNLSHLVFTLKRVKLLNNKLSFQMANNLDAYKVLRNYCKLFNSITEYRSQGYDDQALTYEIQLSD